MTSQNTTEAGYGWTHRQVREQWRPMVERGEVCCARCGRPIPAGAPWDLGHVDGDKSAYRGPEHRRCNRATATHKMRARMLQAVRGRSWEW